MTIRIEFPRAKSSNFDRVLSICRRLPGFKESSQDGLPLYSVEFAESEMESLQAVLDFVANWKLTAYYLDDKLVSRGKIYKLAADHFYDEIRRKSEAERQALNAEKQKRWKEELDKRFPKNQEPTIRIQIEPVSPSVTDIRKSQTPEDLIRRQQERDS